MKIKYERLGKWYEVLKKKELPSGEKHYTIIDDNGKKTIISNWIYVIWGEK